MTHDRESRSWPWRDRDQKSVVTSIPKGDVSASVIPLGEFHQHLPEDTRWHQQCSEQCPPHPDRYANVPRTRGKRRGLFYSRSAPLLNGQRHFSSSFHRDQWNRSSSFDRGRQMDAHVRARGVPADQHRFIDNEEGLHPPNERCPFFDKFDFLIEEKIRQNRTTDLRDWAEDHTRGHWDGTTGKLFIKQGFARRLICMTKRHLDYSLRIWCSKVERRISFDRWRRFGSVPEWDFSSDQWKKSSPFQVPRLVHRSPIWISIRSLNRSLNTFALQKEFLETFHSIRLLVEDQMKLPHVRHTHTHTHKSRSSLLANNEEEDHQQIRRWTTIVQLMDREWTCRQWRCRRVRRDHFLEEDSSITTWMLRFASWSNNQLSSSRNFVNGRTSLADLSDRREMSLVEKVELSLRCESFSRRGNVRSTFLLLSSLISGDLEGWGWGWGWDWCRRHEGSCGEGGRLFSSLRSSSFIPVPVHVTLTFPSSTSFFTPSTSSGSSRVRLRSTESKCWIPCRRNLPSKDFNSGWKIFPVEGTHISRQRSLWMSMDEKILKCPGDSSWWKISEDVFHRHFRHLSSGWKKSGRWNSLHFLHLDWGIEGGRSSIAFHITNQWQIPFLRESFSLRPANVAHRYATKTIEPSSVIVQKEIHLHGRHEDDVWQSELVDEWKVSLAEKIEGSSVSEAVKMEMCHPDPSKRISLDQWPSPRCECRGGDEVQFVRKKCFQLSEARWEMIFDIVDQFRRMSLLNGRKDFAEASLRVFQWSMNERQCEVTCLAKMNPSASGKIISRRKRRTIHWRNEIGKNRVRVIVKSFRWRSLLLETVISIERTLSDSSDHPMCRCATNGDIVRAHLGSDCPSFKQEKNKGILSRSKVTDIAAVDKVADHHSGEAIPSFDSMSWIPWWEHNNQTFEGEGGIQQVFRREENGDVCV